MARTLDSVFEDKPYPGRVIIVGKNMDGAYLGMYAVTGRSDSSRARHIEYDPNTKRLDIKVNQDADVSAEQRELIEYPAIMATPEGIAISNGRQTESIVSGISGKCHPDKDLRRSLKDWSYEPDEPNFTPRISACIQDYGVALSIIRRSPDSDKKTYRGWYAMPPREGIGYLISTYQGSNENPLPSFSAQDPIRVKLDYHSVQDACDALYHALRPREDAPDFRVASAAIKMDWKDNPVVGGRIRAQVSFRDRVNHL